MIENLRSSKIPQNFKTDHFKQVLEEVYGGKIRKIDDFYYSSGKRIFSICRSDGFVVCPNEFERVRKGDHGGCKIWELFGEGSYSTQVTKIQGRQRSESIRCLSMNWSDDLSRDVYNVNPEKLKA